MVRPIDKYTRKMMENEMILNGDFTEEELEQAINWADMMDCREDGIKWTAPGIRMRSTEEAERLAELELLKMTIIAVQKEEIKPLGFYTGG